MDSILKLEQMSKISKAESDFNKLDQEKENAAIQMKLQNTNLKSTLFLSLFIASIIIITLLGYLFFTKTKSFKQLSIHRENLSRKITTH